MLLAPRIEADKEIRFGKPVIKGTRVPVDLILGKLAAGMTYEEVRQEYAIEKEDILAAYWYVKIFPTNGIRKSLAIRIP